jgi:tetratricopeptide (TPR) repeat protein
MNRAQKMRHMLLAALAAALTFLFVVFGILVDHYYAPSLPGHAAQLGEVAMKEGARSEVAGDLPGALAHYQRALAGKFQGLQNRSHVEKRCGVVLWKLGDAESAVPYLRRAQESPKRSLNGFRPLVESLIATGELEEAGTVAQTWRDAAESHIASLADAQRAQGQLAIRSGKSDEARKHFLAAVGLDPSHVAQVDLARLTFDEGHAEQAMALATTYLSSAPPGNESLDTWKRLAEWAK